MRMRRYKKIHLPRLASTSRKMLASSRRFLSYFCSRIRSRATGFHSLVLAALCLCCCWLLWLIFSETQNHQGRPAKIESHHKSSTSYWIDTTCYRLEWTKSTLEELIEYSAARHAQPRVPSVSDSYSRHSQVEELVTEKKNICHVMANLCKMIIKNI